MNHRPTTCAVPSCPNPVLNYRHRLCSTHYNRAKDRRRNSRGTLAWSTIAAHPEILNGQRLRIVAPRTHPIAPEDTPVAARSCLTCTHLKSVPPRFITCARNQWAGTINLAIEVTEFSGMPTHLVGRARTCPHFSPKP